MDVATIYFVFIGSSLNGLISLFLALKFYKSGVNNYLEKQFRNFFLFFSFYLLLFSLATIYLNQNLYLYLVTNEIIQILLFIAIACLFSGFIFVKTNKENLGSLWIFILSGFMLTIIGLATIDPAKIHQSNFYNTNDVIIGKTILLSIGFLYPAFYFIKEALKNSPKKLKKKYLLLGLSFICWWYGGLLLSKHNDSYIFFSGSLIVLLGFFLITYILLLNNKEKGPKKDPF